MSVIQVQDETDVTISAYGRVMSATFKNERDMNAHIALIARYERTMSAT